MEKLSHLETLCRYTRNVLSSVYDPLHEVALFSDFFVESEQSGPSRSRVLFEESQDDFFLGIHFCEKVRLSCEQGTISLETLSVVAEETSHFLALADSVNFGGQTSLLNLEVLGEIDRFLVFSHYFSRHFWEKTGTPSTFGPQGHYFSMREVQNVLFSERRFENDLSPSERQRYADAEARAINELSKALSDLWGQTFVDWNLVQQRARLHFGPFRKRLLNFNKRTQWAA